MKNRMKKLSLLLCGTMAFGIAACGGNSSANSDTTEKVAQADGTENTQDGTQPQGPGGTEGMGEPPTEGGGPGGDGNQPPDKPGGGGTGQAGSTDVDSNTSVQEYSADTEEEEKTYTSTGTDENAILVSGGKVKLNKTVINRTSSDSTGGDNSSFYGVGAAVLVSDGEAYIDEATINTDAAGGAGVFAYDKGVTYIADTAIKTNQDTSGGIHAAGGGTLYAWDLTVETNGASSAAIRSDRGGGKMVVDGGEYTSNGAGSPAIYCTADIAVNKATLTATQSEAVCIEGLNSLYLYDCMLTGTMSDDPQNDCTWNVIVYQSMSGDSKEGNGIFSMSGGSLTAEKDGGMFYTTNTESTFYLNGVDITYANENDFFLRCTGNANKRGWGSTGSNGADCSFTADTQEMTGDIQWDSISKLDFYMQYDSVLRGAIVDDESCAGSGGDGYCNLYISSDSTWIVTGNSTLSALFCEGDVVDDNGATVTILGADGKKYVEGDSDYTVTVGKYKQSADFSGAFADTSFYDDHEVTKPF